MTVEKLLKITSTEDNTTQDEVKTKKYWIICFQLIELQVTCKNSDKSKHTQKMASHLT